MPRTLGLSPLANTANTSTSIWDTTFGATPSVFTFDDASVEEHRLRPGISHTQVQRLTPPLPSPRIPLTPSPTTTTTTATTTSNEDAGNSSYESVFLASSHPLNEDNTSTSTNSSRNDESNERYAALMEYRSLGNAETENPAEQSREVRATTSNIRKQLTLREQQVMHLRREMSHPAGVRLQLGRRDCKDGIAFVDTFGAVW